MRLTEIKLAGFKTFVDPTVISIPGNLVGIVGPNGCGKSNIIDAVRWVLGESRASALRGESLQDVIFNGSATRRLVGRASVELIFDNHAGKAAGQWKAYSEIAIRRVIQRDAESSYYINNIRVRRRDIIDLFLGTGISGRGYAIIEQGMISRIIEARPQELRTFLEEAAGISRYHERRHETELRLTDARSNLQRVDDVLQELGKQQQHLEVQAEQAAHYQRLHQQLAAAQRVLWAKSKQRAAALRDKAQQEIESFLQKTEALRIDLQQFADKQIELRTRHQVVNDQQHQIQGALYATKGEIARIEQSIQHIRANKAQFDQQLAQIQQQLLDHERQLDEVNKSLMVWSEKLAQTESDYLTQQTQYECETKKLPQLEAVQQTDQALFVELKEKLSLASQNEKLQQNQQIYVEKILQQLTVRYEQLLAKQSNQLEIDVGQLDELQQESAEFAVLLEENQGLLDQREAEVHAAQQKRDALQQTVQLLQRDLAQLNARLDVLQRLQDQIEDNQGLNTWLAATGLNALPRLWQLLSVEPGWEAALEAILRERLQAVVIDQLEQVLNWEHGEKKRPTAKWSVCERVTPDDAATNFAVRNQQGWKSLNELVTHHDSAIQVVLESWLYGVFVVDSLVSGLELKRQLMANEILVTAEGHSITSCGVHYFAPDSATHGILQRQSEIVQIKAKCGQINQSILQQQQLQAEAEQDYQHGVNKVAQVRQVIEEIKIQLHDRQLQITHVTQQMERVEQERAQLEAERVDLAAQIEEESSRQYQLEVELVACESKRIELTELTQQAEVASQLSNQALLSHRSLVQRLMDALKEVSFSKQDCQNRANDCKQRTAMIIQNKMLLTENMQKLQDTHAELDEVLLMEEVEQWQIQHNQHERDLVAARHELENVEQILHAAEHDRMQAEQQLYEYNERVSQARLREQEAAITEKQFVDKLAELGEIVCEAEQQFVEEKTAKLQKSIDQLNSEIAALGSINLGAPRELEALQLRRTYFEEESLDLREAIDALGQAIQQINHETRRRLQVTFEQVNNYLSELFAAIFGGGTAQLALDHEDILEAGVLLTAHPPGKRNSSIQLLSGGEKALTALALVFSLFKLNPAPFCLLDEVDAPLDDNNVGRFCQLVQRMAVETQFLFISHNKLAMQMAQQLIGITMREQGVSRVVTVDLDKIIAAQN